MNNLFFSLNSTVPIFILILIGYILKRLKITNENFVNVSNKINFVLTLPVLLFYDLWTADFKDVFDLNFLLFCMLITCFCFCTIWILSKIFIKDKSIVGAFVQGSYRGSAAVLGIAFIQNMYNGSSGMGPLMVAASVPLYNIFAVTVLTFESNSNSEKTIKKTFINICKNPIIIAIILGILASFLNIKLPFILSKSLSNIASLATPLALISIGASFKGRAALKKVKPSIIAASIKLVVQPILFMPLAIYLGYRDQKLIAILIMLAAPTTASCYIMAASTDNDTVLTSSIIVLTTFLSAITLTIFIFILKTMSLI